MTRRRQSGFSLIELLIVLAVIMALSAIAVPNLLRARQTAYEASAAGLLRTLQSAQIAHRSTTGAYASTFDELPEVWVNTSTSTSAGGSNSGSPGNSGNSKGNPGNQKGAGNSTSSGNSQGAANSQAGGNRTNPGAGNSGGNSATVLVRSNYIFTLTTVSAEQWRCAAAPTLDRTNGRYFYTDETGVTRVEIGRTASASSPALQ